MMRRRLFHCTLLTLTALVGCVPATTPGPVPSATSVPTPTVTPIPGATASPSPTPDLRVIDAHPETLILTLEEAGLETTHIISNCEAMGETGESPETSVRITGWSCTFLALNSNLDNNLQMGLLVHQSARVAADSPVLSPSYAYYQGDLEIGDRGAIHYQPSELPSGSIHHQYSVAFSFRNIFVYLSSGSESATEDTLDWLTDIAFTQFEKLLSVPLLEEFEGQW